MTRYVAVDTTVTSEVMERGGLDATYQHISMLYRKQQMLRSSQIAAEEQFLHRLSALYSSEAITEVELALMYRAYADYAVPGFMKRWDAAVPVPAGRMQYILTDLKTKQRHIPNGPDETWRGEWPYAVGDRLPVSGTCVVYVLYDKMTAPCYVGSTQDLSARLKAHHKDGKPFVRWTAFPCADREAAYRLEEKLLGEHQPYLNKKRWR